MSSPTFLLHRQHWLEVLSDEPLVQRLVANMKGHNFRHLQLFNPATSLFGGESRTQVRWVACFRCWCCNAEETRSPTAKQWSNDQTLLLKDLDPSVKEAEAKARAQKDGTAEKAAQQGSQKVEKAVSTDPAEEEVEDATQLGKHKALSNKQEEVGKQDVITRPTAPLAAESESTERSGDLP